MAKQTVYRKHAFFFLTHLSEEEMKAINDMITEMTPEYQALLSWLLADVADEADYFADNEW